MDGKNYILAIAIDNYHHFSPLNNAVKDVDTIINILCSLYQFDEENVHRLFNDEATEDGIDYKLLELVDILTENDNLIIFYSGHGYYRKNVREGYWVPVNGRRDKVSDYISNANLIRYLQNIHAHHIMMFVDSCFSGALVEQLRGDANSERYPSRRVFVSGRVEMISDGIPGEHSPFAQGIIDFLKANMQIKASVTQLIDSVRNYVGRVSSQDPIEGRLRTSRDNRGEFFFRRNFSEPEYWKLTLEKNTVDAYKLFIETFPGGEYIPIAVRNMEALRRSNDKPEKKSAATPLKTTFRKSIKITKKTFPKEQKQKIIVRPSSFYPKIMPVESNPLVRKLLIGRPEEYRKLSLQGDLWENSFVSDLYIREIVAYRLEQYVFQEHIALNSSRGENIPEIGGWLLGKHIYDELNDKYLVSFERFIQINRLNSNSTQLVLDAYAWQVLERAKDIYLDEELEVAGWVHTHPGWGVFMSQDDINTHETFFTEPYHISMVLECLKAPYDVGFFTKWKAKGKLVLNNRAQAYYRWEDFRKWMGK